MSTANYYKKMYESKEIDMEFLNINSDHVNEDYNNGISEWAFEDGSKLSIDTFDEVKSY